MIENLNLKGCSENELKIIKEFQDYQKNIREDHYDGENIIYRFAATITKLFGKPIFTDDETETQNNIEIVKAILDSNDIKPYSILNVNEEMNIDWMPNGDQIIRSIEEYLQVSLEFARYVDSIKCLDVKVQTGMYSDDPLGLADDVRFNKESFGRNTYKYPHITNIGEMV